MDANAYVELTPNRNIPSFRTGDTVRVHAFVVEGQRRRIQVFEGVVIRIRRGGVNSNFTVRRVSSGVGVERVFPYHSPLIDKVEVARVGRVRRSRLYYLRERVGKAARIRAGERDRFESLAAELAAGAAAIQADEVAEAEAPEEPAAEEDEAAPEPAAGAAAEEPAAEAAAEEPAAEAETPAEEPVAEAETPAEEPAAEAETPAEQPAAEAEAAPESAAETAAAEEAAAAPEPAAAETPAAEDAGTVEEPETPAAEQAEQLIETESGEEPGEAIKERK